ncbi:MAG: hypothetical protein ACK56W_24830 [Pirellula sp.]|jgi:hypothetical protein|nr:serine protease [Pirellula sp.]
MSQFSDRLKQFTVKLPELDGQGVLVRGGFIITAAHCFQWDYNDGAGMALGDHVPVVVSTASGKQFRCGPYFVDIANDLAVLGMLDNQVFVDDCDKFETFCDENEGFDVCRTLPPPYEDFPLEVWSHEGFSFDCTGSIWDPIARYVFMQGPVKGGTSGGPILTKSGHLLSIVSNSSNARGCEVESDEDQIGRNPILWKCLPEFIREQLE